ncbi:MAG: desulfoferrodoxin family protein [Myxococcota bacterium]
MPLDRRDFVMTSLRLGTASLLLPACEPPEAEPLAEGEGTFGAPYTRAAPGPWGNKVEIHLPRLYGARIDDKRIRLWLEIEDVTQDPVVNHDMTVQHYISQLVLQDEFQNVIDSRTFAPGTDARMIASIEVPAEVGVIEAYALCNLHGWWRALYDIKALSAEPDGTFRRPYTNARPGEWVDKTATHTPVLGQRPNGYLSVEIGDRDKGALHPMTAEHYIESIYLFDELDQLRAYARLGPAFEEPVADFPATALGGTGRARVLAYCNLHGWWDAQFTVGS